MRNKYKIKLTEDQANELLSDYPITAGCTCSFPKAFPNTFTDVGIDRRPTPRFSLLGLTVSKDNDREDEVVFGISYVDHEDSNQHDEDHFLLSKGDLNLTKLTGKRLEKYNKKYKNTHHGDKSYLINTHK